MSSWWPHGQRMAYEDAAAQRQQASEERMNALDNEVKILIAEKQARASAEAAKVAAENKPEPQGAE